MKIQGVTVIFSLIVIPVILVLSYYIQMQVDTIALQTSYDTKLLDATHDAMAAFEINTANENLSSVADSLRSIITASNNVFINSLSTNFGMSNASKSMLEPYIPAVLYTLYDGYYIYSPTKTPEVLVNPKGNAVVVGDSGVEFFGTSVAGDYNIYTYTPPADDEDIDPNDELILTTNTEEYGQVLYKLDGEDGKYTTVVKEGITKYKLDYVLKSFMPYSARYIKEDANIDVTVNYTLDNYLVINGVIGDIYYSKSGYLIKQDLLNEVTVGGNPDTQILTRNEEEIDDIVDNADQEIQITLNSKIGDANQLITISSNTDDGKDAIKYYLKSTIFSNWVYENLSEIVEGEISLNAIEIQNLQNRNLQNQQSQIINSFEGSTKKIFVPDADPESDDSPIATHKSEIIRNSIQYNLNVAMSAYNEMSGQAFAFNMPVILDSEWKKITSNVCVVAFMQGFRCGMKFYNNYAIVPSTNNELTVIPSEIYYISNDEATGNDTFNDESSIYHRIDCPDFNYPEALPGEEISNLGFRFFRSKEVKYDKIYNKTNSIYEYDHKNLACYKCIINGNYKKAFFNGTDIVPPENGRYSNSIDIISLPKQKQRLYFTAVGAERQRIYKSNAIKDSQGLEVEEILGGTVIDNFNESISSERDLSEVKQIRVIISEIKAMSNTTPIAKFDISVNGQLIGENIALNVQKKAQTVVMDIDLPINSRISNIEVRKVAPADEEIRFTVNEIEIIYK